MTAAAPLLDIRLCDATDAEAIWPVFLRLYEHYGMAEALTPEDVRVYVREQVLGPDSSISVAVASLGQTPIGLATFTVVYPAPACQGQVFMKDLFVDTAHRGYGAGHALMTFVARYAVDHNCGRFDWTTETSNPHAIAFYTRLGAEPVENKVYYRMAGGQLTAFASSGK